MESDSTYGPSEPDSQGKVFVRIGGDKQRRGPTTETAPSEATNLVALMSKSEQEFIGQRVWDLYVKDVRSRAPRMKKLQEFIELYASVMKAKRWPFQNAANINLPLLTYPILQVQARLYDMVWPENGKVIFSAPAGPEDTARADATEKFGNSYIRHRMPEMEQGLDDSLAQMCLFGSAIRRTYWDAYEQRVRSDWVALEDFVVAHEYRSQDPSLRGVPRYTLVHHMTIADLEALGEAGVFENVDGIELAGNDGTAEGQELKDTRNKLDGTSTSGTDTDDPDRPRMVLEMHCRWRLPDAPKKHEAFDGKNHYVIITVDEPTKKVLRVVLREEDDPQDRKRYEREMQQFVAYEQQASVTATVPGVVPTVPKVQRPAPPRKREICFFTHYRAFPSEGFYGLGFGDFIAPLNRAGNTLLNQHIDGVTVRNAKPGFISRQLRTQRGSVYVQPGELVEVDGPVSAMKEGIMFLDPPGNDPTTMPLIKMVVDLGDKLAGSADLMSGSTSGANRTAKEIQVLNSQLMKQISVLARRVKGAFKHELDKIWRIWGVFLPETPEETPVVDPSTGQPVTLPISRALFIPDARVTPAADPRMRFEKLEEAQAKFGFVMNNPMTAQNPLAVYEGTAEVLQSMGAERILAVVQKPQPPPPPQAMPHWEEAAQWLQGQAPPTHPDDNDEEHKQAHMAFLSGPRAQMMDKNQRAAAEQHLRDHDAQAMRKAGTAMMQQQQMMAGGPPPGPMGPQGPMGGMP